jgi:hypothetical protein
MRRITVTLLEFAKIVRLRLPKREAAVKLSALSMSASPPSP